jgi:hypothetical protein
MDFDAHRLFFAQALFAHIAHKAPRTIAAVLHLAAVGVVDDVFKINIWAGGGAHTQDLIGPNAKVPVCQPTVLGGAQVQALLGFVQHDKVVADALHFGEADVHLRIICEDRFWFEVAFLGLRCPELPL